MSYLANDELATPMLAAAGTALASGFLHFFAGPVPTAPNAALDMVNDHTLLVTISLNGGGVTGLTFGTAAAGVLPKAPAETWAGTATFSGAEDAEASLTATFCRFCTAGDNGQGAGTTARLQGTVGATGSGSDVERSSAVIVAGTEVPVTSYNVRIGSLG